jgi:hypothetical protein
MSDKVESMREKIENRFDDDYNFNQDKIRHSSATKLKKPRGHKNEDGSRNRLKRKNKADKFWESLK